MNAPVDTRLIQQLDSAHFLHPFTDFKDLATRGARVITRADGIYVWDSEGQKMLDAMSGLWCVNAGYGRRELADAAHAQMMTLPFYNSFFREDDADHRSVRLSHGRSGQMHPGNEMYYLRNERLEEPSLELVGVQSGSDEVLDKPSQVSIQRRHLPGFQLFAVVLREGLEQVNGHVVGEGDRDFGEGVGADVVALAVLVEVDHQ